MKNVLTLFTVAVLNLSALSALSATQAIAPLYHFQDFDEITTELSVTGVSSYTGGFNLVTGDQGELGDIIGYDPLSMSISSGNVRFVFSTLFGEEAGTLNLTLGPSMLLDGYVVDFTSVFEGSVSGNALFDLSDTGLLSYRVDVTAGMLNLDTAVLEVSAVPEPGSATLALVFGALLGIRKIRKIRTPKT